MDLATIVAKMSQYGGLLPPGSDKVIKLMKEYPRSTVAVGSFVVWFYSQIVNKEDLQQMKLQPCTA